DALLVTVGSTGKEGRLFIPSACANLKALAPSALKGLVLPIVTGRIILPVVTRRNITQFRCIVIQISVYRFLLVAPLRGVHSVIIFSSCFGRLPKKLDILPSIHKVQFMGSRTRADLIRCAKLCSAGLTVFGINDDHAVGSPRPIDSCGRSIF